MICKACESCQTAKVRRQQVSGDLEQADKEDLPPPSIDYYGHTQGDILVAIDLFTREPSLWFLSDRKMNDFTYYSSMTKLKSLWTYCPQRDESIPWYQSHHNWGHSPDLTQTLNVSCSI